MPSTTPNMSLVEPADATDTYDEQAYDNHNYGLIDAHNHSGPTTNGVQLGTAALIANAITQLQAATGTTNGPTTTSTSFVDLPDPQVTITTNGGDLLVWFTGAFTANGAGDIVTVQLACNGGTIVGTSISANITVANAQETITLCARVTSLPAGTYTVKAQWQTNAGTATAYSTQRVLVVEEVKR